MSKEAIKSVHVHEVDGLEFRVRDAGVDIFDDDIEIGITWDVWDAMLPRVLASRVAMGVKPIPEPAKVKPAPKIAKVKK